MSHHFRSSLDSYNEHKPIDKDTSDLLARLPLHFKFPSVKHKLTNRSFKTSTSLSLLFFQPSTVSRTCPPMYYVGTPGWRTDGSNAYLPILSLLTFSTLIRKTEYRSVINLGFITRALLTLYQQKLSSPCRPYGFFMMHT